MKHNLKISISKEAPGGGIIRCRNITLRERLLKRLFGEKCKMTVIIPGDSVECVSIQEFAKEAHSNERA